LRGVAEQFAKKVRSALRGRLTDFAKRTDAAEEEAGDALDGVSFSTDTILRASAGVAEKAVRHSKQEFKRLGIEIRDEPNLDRLRDSWRSDSAARVEKILARERDTIVQLLSDSEDRTPDELQDRIDDRLEVTKSKLDTAAHDDVLTLNGHLTRERQTSAGVTRFVWTTTGDERVRESHAEIDGQECDWDDPPLVDDEEAIPGDPYNCRCVAFPVLEELDGDSAEEDDDADEDAA
jgi:SPP1 gp7 family putative phage head morphogenesis protein